MWAQQYNVQLSTDQLPYQTTVFVPHSLACNMLPQVATSMASPTQAYIVQSTAHGSYLQACPLQQVLPAFANNNQWETGEEQPQEQPQGQEQLQVQTEVICEQQEQQQQQLKADAEAEQQNPPVKLHRYGASLEMLNSGAAFPWYHAHHQNPTLPWNPNKF